MVISVLTFILGAAILIGIVSGVSRSLIEAFPVVGIVLPIVLAVALVIAVSYLIYRFVKFLQE